MAKEQRGKRDGSGPYKGSLQRKEARAIGKRQQAGKACPKK